ncbi:MAG: hypothetical protein GF403_08505 [Candidatus Coatesbacteria bacterium]|nr:hypothetical protein [Candidatus Coatesbacteria bacterium]
MNERYSVRDELDVRYPAENQARIKALAINAQPPNPRARKKPPSFASWKPADDYNHEAVKAQMKASRDVRSWGEADFRLYGYLGDGMLTVVDLSRARIVYHGPPPEWYPEEETMTQFVLERSVGEY